MTKAVFIATLFILIGGGFLFAIFNISKQITPKDKEVTQVQEIKQLPETKKQVEQKGLPKEELQEQVQEEEGQESDASSIGKEVDVLVRQIVDDDDLSEEANFIAY